jgi:hypothetical protein
MGAGSLWSENSSFLPPSAFASFYGDLVVFNQAYQVANSMSSLDPQIGLVEPKPGANPVKILPPRGPPRQSKDGISAQSQESKKETTNVPA